MLISEHTAASTIDCAAIGGLRSSTDCTRIGAFAYLYMTSAWGRGLQA